MKKFSILTLLCLFTASVILSCATPTRTVYVEPQPPTRYSTSINIWVDRENSIQAFKDIEAHVISLGMYQNYKSLNYIDARGFYTYENKKTGYRVSVHFDCIFDKIMADFSIYLYAPTQTSLVELEKKVYEILSR